jgi:hypothetical protein
MPNYNFNTLSGHEFEILVRDLLQEELSIRLESFKSGRDKGIDLRYAPSKDNSLIVQCKHYVGSGTTKLLADLKTIESPKVKKLSPKRYIIATSAGLNPSDKEKILELFPACSSTSDIYGKDDLNNLLARHPKVESNHYKLWLSSVHVLETLIKSAAINRTRLDLERIHSKFKFYVQNGSFTKAKEILDKQHYCIIAGIPGIGKTTLAEALFIDHISQGYEPVRIYGGIDEGFEMFKEGIQQVFYFDDFLGTTTFDENSLERNEDKQLLAFLHSVHSSFGSKKLILTSRDYILNQARLSFESIRSADLKPYLCIVNVQNYTRLNKAKILYNHLYFSELSKRHIAELLKDRRYLSIIDHPYYSPRVIEWMTQMRDRWPHSEEDFAVAFLNALDNPMEIWKHAFDRDLSLSARYILWVMISLPDRVSIDDLERIFRPFQRYMAEYHRHSIDTMDFHDGLVELEGTFVDIELLAERVRIIRFHNASIRDFLEIYLSEHEVVIRFLARSSEFFSQIRWLWGKYEIRIPRSKQLVQIRPRYRLCLLKHPDDFVNDLRRTLYSDHISSYRRRSYRLADRLLLLVEFSRAVDAPRMNDLMTDAIRALKVNANQGNETSFDLMKLAKSLNGSTYFNDVKEAFLNSLHSWSDFERYLVFKVHYSNQLTSRDEEIVQQRLSSRYPGKHLSYVDAMIDEAEALADEQWADEFGEAFDDEWLKDEFYEELTGNKRGEQSERSDPNEDIADLFDGLDI